MALGNRLKVSESAALRAILDYLRIRGYICKRNQSGMVFKDKFAIRLGEAGWPDIIGLTKQGRFFGIEVKSSVGYLSPGQREIGKQIIASGGMWFMAKTIDDVERHGL